MAEAKRVIRPLITVACIGFSVLAFYNVYGDSSEVDALAKTTACAGKKACTARTTQVSRKPWGQSYVFQTQAKSQVNIKCQRAFFMLGEYSCQNETP